MSTKSSVTSTPLPRTRYMEALAASAGGKLQKALLGFPAKVHVPLAVHKYERMGNGLKSLAAVQKDAPIVSVSLSVPGLKLQHLDPLKEKLTSPVLKYVDESILQGQPHLSQRMRLAFQFSNILRDRGHPLFPYLDALPLENLTFPIYWKSPSSSFSPRLREEIMDYLTNVRSMYDKIYSSERKVLSNVSFEEFIWTHYMADSRSVQVGKELHFVPVVDLVNHSFARHNCTVEKVGEDWTLKATSDIAEDSQLFLHYGPYDSYKYIARWGFFEEGNPHQAVYCQPDMLPDWDRIVEIAKLTDKSPISDLANPASLTLHQLKRQLLQKHQLSILMVPLPISPPALTLEATLRILFLQVAEMQALGYTDVEHVVERLEPGRPISKENEQRVQRTVLKLALFNLQCRAEDWKPELEMCALLEREEREVLIRTRDYYLSLQKVSVAVR